MNNVERQHLRLCSLGAAAPSPAQKHLLESGGRRILVDCGLFQGVKNLRELNWEPLAVERAGESIDAVVITTPTSTTGYLPRLVRDRTADRSSPPRPPEPSPRSSCATAPTCGARRCIPQQAQRLQAPSRPAAVRQRGRRTRHGLFETPSVHWSGGHALESGPAVMFRRAGHILGASTVEVSWAGPGASCSPATRALRRPDHVRPRAGHVRGLPGDGVHLRRPGA